MAQVLEVKTEMVRVMPDEPAIGTFWRDRDVDIWRRVDDGTWRIVQFKDAKPMMSDAWAGGGCEFSYVMEAYGPLTEASSPWATPEPTLVFAMVPEVAFEEWWTAACERNGVERYVFDGATAKFIAAVHGADLAPNRIKN